MLFFFTYSHILWIGVIDTGVGAVVTKDINLDIALGGLLNNHRYCRNSAGNLINLGVALTADEHRRDSNGKLIDVGVVV